MTPELRTRVVTGFSVAIPLIGLLLATRWSCWVRWGLLSLAFIVCSLGVYEFVKICCKSDRIRTADYSKTVALYLACLLAPLVIGYLVLSNPCLFLKGVEHSLLSVAPLFVSLQILGVLLVSLLALYFSRNDLQQIFFISRDLLWGLLSIVCGGIALMIFAVHPDAGVLLFWFLLVICLNDVGAYFVGKSVGGVKLAPAISPNKTLSGSLGGILVGCLVAYLSSYLVTFVDGLYESFGIGVVLVVAAQAGDLLQSCFKRLYGVKDSGWLFPGHGGVLDRIDGVLFSAPVLLAWILWRYI